MYGYHHGVDLVHPGGKDGELVAREATEYAPPLGGVLAVYVADGHLQEPRRAPEELVSHAVAVGVAAARLTDGTSAER